MKGNQTRPALSRRQVAARNDRVALVAVLVLMAGMLGTSMWLLG